MENLMDLTGRNIVVTGAAQGIGEAVARMAHGLGAKVVLIDVLGEKLETLAAAEVRRLDPPLRLRPTVGLSVAASDVGVCL